MKKFLLLLALFCLFGSRVTVLDCTNGDGGEEEIYEIEEEGEEELSPAEKAWEEILPYDYLIQKEGTAANTAVKALQDDFLKPGKHQYEQNIKQLRSLNQDNKNVKKTFGLKCGLYVAYNLIFMANIINATSDFDAELKKYQDLNNGVILGSTTNTEEKQSHNEFVIWVTNQEKKLTTEPEYKNTYTTIAEIPEIIKEKEKLTNKKPENLTEPDKTILKKFENIELKGEQIGYLIKENIEKNLDRFLIFDTKDLNDLIDTNSIKYMLDNALSFNKEKKDLIGLFYEKIKLFRNTGTPMYLILSKSGHWFCVAMTTKGMYMANSLENKFLDDPTPLQKLYDYILFGNLPEETKIEVKPPAPKQDPLANALALLKAKLLSLAKQLTAKS